MLKHVSRLSVLLMSCAIALSGCATSPPPVGRVVVAPQAKQPEIPALVQETLPRPPGYYQTLILDALESP